MIGHPGRSQVVASARAAREGVTIADDAATHLTGQCVNSR